MLTAQHITYQVGGGKKLLDDVSVAFRPGDLNLIIGPNGAGKSTLVKVLCHQLLPQKGSVFYGDRNAADIPIGELAQFRSVLSQNVELAFPLSAEEVVMMGRYPHFNARPAEKDRAACEAAMQFFDVVPLADRNYLTLSGGEQQRIHFARVMAQIWYPAGEGCRYILLDEPLTFLDIHYQFDFMHKILELLREKDLVAVGVVHDLNLAAKFADRITLLHQGRVLADGSPETVLTTENIRTAYRLEPVIHREGGELRLFF
ncbi:MAG: heme ABC transporter ATP-binding protein [Lewinellaceae bacterium]|nr:heme ABC transporter ATP-binding protein [Lewinella sp.]MCB9281452.1 heme ABC transporter ATP-binding protein [Lewinellaceae bacterium]